MFMISYLTYIVFNKKEGEIQCFKFSLDSVNRGDPSLSKVSSELSKSISS